MSAVPLRADTHDHGLPADIEMEFVDCLHCGSDDHETLLFSGDPVTGIGGRFRVVRCRSCRLTFTNPRPTVAAIGQFYPDDYAPHMSREQSQGLRHQLYDRLEQCVLRASFGYPPAANWRTRALAFVGRMAIRNSRQRQTWFPFRPPGRLLDFGCGAGRFLREMSRLGWQAEGLDISEATAQRIQKETGLPVHVGTLPHPRLVAGQFDAVTMWNSLEHVHRPRETVRAAAELLRPGGLLIVGLQNFDAWSAARFGEHWSALDLPRHLTHFTPSTLSALLAAEGFRVHSVNQVERDGWIRQSARRLIQSGGGNWMSRLYTWKPAARLIAGWTRRTARADAMRAVAEKV